MLPALCFVSSNKGRWKIAFGLYTTRPGQERLNPSTGEKLMLSLESLIINISLQLFSLTLVSFLTSERFLSANPRRAQRTLPVSAASPGTLPYECPFPPVLLSPGNRNPLVPQALDKPRVPVSASWRCSLKVGAAHKEMRRGRDNIYFPRRYHLSETHQQPFPSS